MEKKTGKEKMLAVLHDALVGVFSGILITVVLVVVIGFVSGMISGFSILAILNAVRSGLMIIGALLLFVSAGVILGRGSRERISTHEKWKTTYQSLGPIPVFLLMAATVLAFAVTVDYIVWLS